MAIRDVRQLRGIKLTESKSDKGTVTYEGSLELLVLSTVKDESFATIMNDTATWPNFFGRAIPQINDVEYVGDVELYVDSRDFEYLDPEVNEFAIKVTVNYIGKPAEWGSEKPPDPDPINNKQEFFKRISIQAVQERRVASESRQDDNTQAAKPIVNSAGDPVDGLEEETALLRLTFTNARCPDPDFKTLFSYMNTCNQFEFADCAAYTLRVTGYGCEFDEKNQVYTVNIEYTYNPMTWKIPYYDVGYNELVGGQRQAILDKSGNPVSKPVPLSDTGAAKAAGLSPSILTASPYERKDFTNMLRECRVL